MALTTKKKPLETSVASRAMLWLTAQGWDCYPEVQLSRYSARADIVATKGRLVWVVEAKTSFGAMVVGQAANWVHRAHFISVAVPMVRSRNDGHKFLVEACADRGIGIIATDRICVDYIRINAQVLSPRLHRPRDCNLIRDRLRPEHKRDGVAGSQGEYYTPWRSTCRALTEFVTDNPGCTIKAAVDGIKHHYRSDVTARACLVRYADGPSIPGVRVDRSQRPFRLWPAT